MHDVITSTLERIRPKSLTHLKVIGLKCSNEIFEQFLDKVLDLVDPANGLHTLSIRMLQGMVLSDHIISKIVSLCKRLQQLIVNNDPEVN